MSDSIKFEYIKMLDEYEALSKVFDQLEVETAKLKEEYKKDPTNEQLLSYIKMHEEKYREIHAKFADLNARSKELLEASKAENSDKK